MGGKFKLLLTLLASSVIFTTETKEFSCNRTCGTQECTPSQYCTSMPLFCPVGVTPCNPVGVCKDIQCPTTKKESKCNLPCIEGYKCQREQACGCKYRVPTCVPDVPSSSCEKQCFLVAPIEYNVV